jgi:hypothetical protein
MATFGHVKNKILVKLTESYGKKDFKDNLKKYFQPIMKNNTLKEMYSLYEDIETMNFDDKETAQLYVEELSKVLKDRYNEVNTSLFDLNESLKDVVKTDNPIYESLDVLSCPDKLGNISSKVIAKKTLVEHLIKTKTSDELTVEQGVNESLLNSVLVNNFNVSFDKTLSEGEKEKLKSILSMTQEEVNTKTKELQETINGRLVELINEDEGFRTKADQVRKEVLEMTPSKYNLHRLEDLVEGLS